MPATFARPTHIRENLLDNEVAKAHFLILRSLFKVAEGIALLMR